MEKMQIVGEFTFMPSSLETTTTHKYHYGISFPNTTWSIIRNQTWIVTPNGSEYSTRCKEKKQQQHKNQHETEFNSEMEEIMLMACCYHATIGLSW